MELINRVQRVLPSSKDREERDLEKMKEKIIKKKKKGG